MKSLRARLVVWVLVGTTLVLAGNGLLIYTIVRGRIHRDMDGELIARAQSHAARTSRELGAEPRQAPAGAPMVGIDFAPWADGQDPSLGARVSVEQLRARLALVADDADVIRTYGVSNGLEEAGRLIHELGKEAVVGAWISDDAAANEAELETLVRLAHAGHVDVAVVGSEVLSRGDLGEAQLRALLARARDELPPGIPLTTAETATRYLRAPGLAEDVDFLFVNIYPYWEGVSIEDAVEALARRYQQVLDLAGGKPVAISESGWPSAGPAIDRAVASPENAARFLAGFTLWARRNEVGYCWFSAFDEAWKGTDELPQEAHWGYRDSRGALKGGIEPILVVGAQGGRDASLEIGSVPPLGSPDPLRGRVSGVGTLTHRIAVYANVDGGWWSLPSRAAPLTRIGYDGRWQVALSTNGEERAADRFAIFLLPAGFASPPSAGSGAIDATVREAALVAEEVYR